MFKAIDAPTPILVATTPLETGSASASAEVEFEAESSTAPPPAFTLAPVCITASLVSSRMMLSASAPATPTFPAEAPALAVAEIV